jgi:hypothetical protein
VGAALLSVRQLLLGSNIMMRQVRLLSLAVLVLATTLVWPSAVLAQSIVTRNPFPVERIFGDVGMQWLSSAGSTLTLATGPSVPRAAFGELAVRFGRIGAGFEYAGLGSRHGEHSYSSFGTFTDDETVRVFLLTCHVQTLRFGRAAVDVTGGVGRYETYSTGSRTRPGGSETTIFSPSRHSQFAFGFGADVPVRVVRYLAIVPRFRAYARQEELSAIPEVSSTEIRFRVTLGVALRAMW